MGHLSLWPNGKSGVMPPPQKETPRSFRRRTLAGVGKREPSSSAPSPTLRKFIVVVAVPPSVQQNSGAPSQPLGGTVWRRRTFLLGAPHFLLSDEASFVTGAHWP